MFRLLIAKVLVYCFPSSVSLYLLVHYLQTWLLLHKESFLPFRYSIESLVQDSIQRSFRGKIPSFDKCAILAVMSKCWVVLSSVRTSRIILSPNAEENHNTQTTLYNALAVLSWLQSILRSR